MFLAHSGFSKLIDLDRSRWSGLNRERPLALKRAAHLANCEVVGRLPWWHAVNNGAMECAIAPFEPSVVPGLQQVCGEQADKRSVGGDLIVLATGDGEH
jgi:hypothetical protein